MPRLIHLRKIKMKFLAWHSGNKLRKFYKAYHWTLRRTIKFSTENISSLQHGLYPYISITYLHQKSISSVCSNIIFCLSPLPSCLGNNLLQPSSSLEIIMWEDKHYEGAPIPKEWNKTHPCIYREKSFDFSMPFFFFFPLIEVIYIALCLWEHGNKNFTSLRNASNDAQLCKSNSHPV